MNSNLKNILTPLAIALLVVGAFFVGSLWQRVQYLEKQLASPSPVSPSNQQLVKENSFLIPIKANEINIPEVNDKDHIQGLKDAKLTWIEYSDLECPFCKKIHPDLQKMMSEYEEKVRWVYRHFPLDAIHSKARREAIASECAAGLGGKDMFWRYVNKIYEITPSNDGLDPAKLPQIADEIGLNKSAFQRCLKEEKYADKVTSDYEGGVKAGVNGTPGNFLLDGKGNVWALNGAYPYNSIKQVIETALKY